MGAVDDNLVRGLHANAYQTIGNPDASGSKIGNNLTRRIRASDLCRAFL
jgi:hypothetical protein